MRVEINTVYNRGSFNCSNWTKSSLSCKNLCLFKVKENETISSYFAARPTSFKRKKKHLWFICYNYLLLTKAMRDWRPMYEKFADVCNEVKNLNQKRLMHSAPFG